MVASSLQFVMFGYENFCSINKWMVMEIVDKNVLKIYGIAE